MLGNLRKILCWKVSLKNLHNQSLKGDFFSNKGSLFAEVAWSLRLPQSLRSFAMTNKGRLPRRAEALLGMTMKGIAMTIPAVALALVLSLNIINTAKADVCFLPDSEGCEQVPYEEYGGNGVIDEDCTGDGCNTQCSASNYCYATEEEAIAARGASVSGGRIESNIGITSKILDSYAKNGNCYCLKNSCGAVLKQPVGLSDSGYMLREPKEGTGWTCVQCEDGNSLLYGSYKCTAKQCTSPATISCVTDECTICVDDGYSGDNICQRPENVAAQCPDGTSETKPSSGCYDKVEKTCSTSGAKECYQTVETPDCTGEGKYVSKADGVCTCACSTGYTMHNGSCVLNQCTNGTAETSCDTSDGYTFDPNGTSFENTSGSTVRCGSCVEEEPEYEECTYTHKQLEFADLIKFNTQSSYQALNTEFYCPYIKDNGDLYGTLERFKGIYKSILFRPGSTFAVYNKIASDSDYCEDSSGRRYYENVCEGTPKGNCTDSDKVFKPNGCTSTSYAIYKDAGPHGDSCDYATADYMGIIKGDEYGSCQKDCSKMGTSYYSSKEECENKNAGKICTSSGGCYGTCEAIGGYSSEAGCGNDCIQTSDGCFYKNTFQITLSPSTKYCCITNNYNTCLGWYMILSDHNGHTRQVSNGNTIEVEAGSYTICVGIDITSPPGGTVHSLSISGFSFDGISLTLNQPGADQRLCTSTYVNLPAGNSMVVRPNGAYQTCTSSAGGAHAYTQ